MSRYVLDTNTVSHVFRQHPMVAKRVEVVPMASLCVSAITAGELLFGLAKRPDAEMLGYEVELDSGEAERTGACVEDALDEQAAAESSADLVEDPEPIFLKDVDPNLMEIPLLITKIHAREAFGVRLGESLDDALNRLARERQGE